MRLHTVIGNGIKGREFSHDLSHVTVFTGLNGVGKSSRLLAAELALRGPQSKDRRYGSAEVVGASAVVDPDGKSGCDKWLQVHRDIAPKHKLTVEGWERGTLKELQGRLDSLLHLAPAVFDLGEFTGMTDDKKRAALLSLAAPVDVAAYAHLCPDVLPVRGESAADWITRAQAAMKEERLALQAQARRSDVTTVTLTSATRGNFENPEPIRAEIATVEARQKRAESYAKLYTRLTQAEADLQTIQERCADLQARPMPVVPEDDGAEARARAELQAAEAVREQHTLAHARRKDLQGRLDRLQAVTVGDPGQMRDVAAAETALERARVESARIRELQLHVRDAQLDIESADKQLAALGRGRLPVQATMVALRAEVLAGDTAVVMASIEGLQQLLDVRGYPAGALLLQTNRAAAEEKLRAIGDVPAGPDVAALEDAVRKAKDHNDQVARVKKSIVEREAGVAQLRAELDALGVAEDIPDTLNQRAKLDKAIAASATRNQATREAAQLQRDRLSADMAQGSARQTVEQLVADLKAHPGDVGDAQQDADRLVELRAALEGAVQRQAVRETESRLAADIAKQAERLVHVKGIETKLKAALEEVLRSSLAPVAEVMQPFCELLGGRFGLGEESPLGFWRGEVWIPLEAASDSEQAVYGAGMALALAGASKGLRLVMLDRLDVCDEARQMRVLELACDLVDADKLDNLLATTHLQPRQFRDDICNIIRL
jgi:hypothetical protein